MILYPADDCLLVKATDLYIDTTSNIELTSVQGMKISDEKEINLLSGDNGISINNEGITLTYKDIKLSITEEGISIQGGKLSIKQ